MKQQDIFVWMLKTMQKGWLPTYYEQQQGKADLVYIPFIEEEIGIKSDAFILQKLKSLGFITEAPPVRRVMYYTNQGRFMQKKDIYDWASLEPVRFEMNLYQVTSLVELRKRFGKIDPDNWPQLWHEWQCGPLQMWEDTCHG